MNHDTFKRLLSKQIDGELCIAETNRLATHLSDCAECRLFAEEIRGLSSSLKESFPSKSVSGALMDRLMDHAINAEQQHMPLWEKIWLLVTDVRKNLVYISVALFIGVVIGKMSFIVLEKNNSLAQQKVYISSEDEALFGPVYPGFIVESEHKKGAL